MTTRGAAKRSAGGVAMVGSFDNMAGGRREPGVMSERRDARSEEERLIRKVFEMIDQDNSGEIDPDELKLLFNTSGLTNSPGFDALGQAVERIMTQAQAQGLGQFDEKTGKGSITEQAFFELLSAKFTKEDSMGDIVAVFERMNNSSGREYLTADDLFQTARNLGENNVTMEQCKEMVKLFNSKYQQDLADAGSKKGAQAPQPPDKLPLEDFIAAMHKDLDEDPNEEEEGVYRP